MKSCGSLLLASAIAAALILGGCAQGGPVELSLSGADTPGMTNADDLDFGPMDHSIATCKAAAQRAGEGRCVKVRAYEARWLKVLAPC
jgi:hypothetical protein